MTTCPGSPSEEAGFQSKFVYVKALSYWRLGPYFQSRGVGEGEAQGQVDVRKIEEPGLWGEVVSLQRPGGGYLDIVSKLMTFGQPWPEVKAVGLDPSPLSSPWNCPRPAEEGAVELSWCGPPLV